MEWLLLHLALWLLWKVPAWSERVARRDGNEIPLYASGDIGDIIGFSLVVFAWQMQIDWWLVGLAVVPALGITGLLHIQWKHTAFQRDAAVSLYDRTGRTLLSGRLHLVYVAVIASVTLAVVGQFIAGGITTDAVGYFVAGWGIYLSCVVVDWLRGVL